MVDEPSGRVWARSKFDWLDRVADDLPGRHLIFCVAHALLRDTDKATGITGIAQREIAGKILVHKRSVQLAIDSLEKAGFLTVIKPKGRRLGNRYRLHLPPEPPKDPSLAVPTALKSGPSLAVHTALKETSLAHGDSLYSGPQAALYPRLPPVEIHPRHGATAAPTPETMTIGDAENGLLDRIVAAIEAVGKKLAKRKKPHNLEPIRKLIANGIPADVAVSAVAAMARKLSAPLGNLDAEFLLEAIRDQAAADGYGTGAETSSRGAAKSDLIRIDGTWFTPAEIRAAFAEWVAAGRWSHLFGATPDDECSQVPAELALIRFPDGYETLAEVEKQVAAWRGGRAWNETRFGFPPDSEFTDVPYTMRGPRRSDAAPNVAKPAAPVDDEPPPEPATTNGGAIRR